MCETTSVTWRSLEPFPQPFLEVSDLRVNFYQYTFSIHTAYVCTHSCMYTKLTGAVERPLVSSGVRCPAAEVLPQVFISGTETALAGTYKYRYQARVTQSHDFAKSKIPWIEDSTALKVFADAAVRVLQSMLPVW